MTIGNNAPWVTIELAVAPPGALVWRCTEVEHLSGEVNQGKHNVFIRLYIDGVLIYTGLSIQYGWAGMLPEQIQLPKKLDKRPPDPSTDIAIEAGMHMWLYVLDPHGYPSDIVRNLHAEMVSDGSGDEWGHNSYDLRFDLVTGSVVVQPPIVDDVQAQLKADMRQIAQIAAKWAL